MRCLVRSQRLLLYNSCNCITVKLVVTYMQVIYIYIHETNHVPRVCNAAAVLHVQLLLHVMLFRL